MGKWGERVTSLNKELQDLKEGSGKEEDLGAMFGDPSLNARFENKEGRIQKLYQFQLKEGQTCLTCVACGVTVTGKRNLDVHITGKRHKFTMAELKTLEPGPPGEDDMVPQEAAIQTLLDDFKEAPLIGIEFLVEVEPGSNGPDPTYRCELCFTTLKHGEVITDLISSAHRLNYLDRYYPVVYQKFQKVPDTHKWRNETFDFLESVVMRIENKNGRLKPQVVASEECYTKTRTSIRTRIFKNIKHFKQTPEQDFASLPDPFSSYSGGGDQEAAPAVQQEPEGVPKKAGPHHNKADEGLDHIEDPDMQSLMQREIAR